ncbi:hypothetical protein JTB14_001519 [Gonioctena quinquepunctata]|nr:hypothetical protein JTB14_001519 [Gonioctena quinquepunctata]
MKIKPDIYFVWTNLAMPVMFSPTAEQLQYYRSTGEPNPFVNKYGKYPVGHPKVFVGDECINLDSTETNGVKINDKLMFSLRRSCCEKMAEECTHSCEEERALSGTWIIDEVLKALEKRYGIKEIHEVWKYGVVQYNPDTKSGGLFSEYISIFF